MHDWRPAQFTLVVDDFGVKYVGEENKKHLINALKKHTRLQLTREERSTSDLRYSGITRNGACTFQCQDIKSKRSPGSITCRPKGYRISRIRTFSQSTERDYNMPRKLTRRLCFPRRAKNLYNKSPARFHITQERWTQPCWRH